MLCFYYKNTTLSTSGNDLSRVFFALDSYHKSESASGKSARLANKDFDRAAVNDIEIPGEDEVAESAETAEPVPAPAEEPAKEEAKEEAPAAEEAKEEKAEKAE